MLGAAATNEEAEAILSKYGARLDPFTISRSKKRFLKNAKSTPTITAAIARSHGIGLLWTRET